MIGLAECVCETIGSSSMLSLNGTGPGCVVHTQLLKLQKEVGFPMRLQLGTQNNR